MFWLLSPPADASSRAEARAWNVKRGSTAAKAAGTIHSDFERTLVRAETVHCEDFVALGGWEAAKRAGKVRMEGKEYVCRDGDVFHFLNSK